MIFFFLDRNFLLLVLLLWSWYLDGLVQDCSISCALAMIAVMSWAIDLSFWIYDLILQGCFTGIGKIIR